MSHDYAGPSYILSVDLGQAADPSAVAVLEKTPVPGGLARYAVADLHRFKLGTEYPDVVSRVARMARRPELRPVVETAPRPVAGGAFYMKDAPLEAPKPFLVIDGTGVGRAIVSMFLAEAMPVVFRPLVITGGLGSREAAWDDRGTRAYWTAKTELVGAVQAVLSSGRLEVPRSLSLAGTLRKELEGFRVHVTKQAHEVYGAREGAHDDLLLAVAMGLWVGEHAKRGKKIRVI